MRLTRKLCGPVCVLSIALALPASAIGQVHCDVLRTAAGAYAGRCVMNSQAVLLLVLRSPDSGTNGRWHGTEARVFGTAGDSTKDVIDWQAFTPAFVDVGANDSTFSWCWCRVTQATVDNEGLHFTAAWPRSPATKLDLDILIRARSYFVNEAQWNRTDTRSRGISYCPADPPSRTLFCALYDATTAARGAFYVRAPSNGPVWAAIAAASPRTYQHPLTDFNNDPNTDFALLTKMLDDAIRRLREELGTAREVPAR